MLYGKNMEKSKLPGMSYSPVGCEFDINEPIYMNKVPLNRNTHKTKLHTFTELTKM